MIESKLKKYPFAYNGEIELSSFFDFLEKNTTLECVPMPEKHIQTIQKKLPKGRKIPKQYLEFLKRAGAYFENWNDSDYIVVTEDNQFLDFGDYLKVKDFPEEELDYEFFLQFQNYGFNAEDCFFFLGIQGNAYAFFRLDDGDDPKVYWVGEGIGRTGTKEPKTFSNMMIQCYNESVKIAKELYSDSPWYKIHSEWKEKCMEELKNEFQYDMDAHILAIPAPHDIYDFEEKGENSLKPCFEILRSALEECMTEISNIYAYNTHTFYVYSPQDDKEIEVVVDIYDEPVFFLSRDYKWGWFTNDKKVYVFGDKFRELIGQNACALGLKKHVEN